MPVYWCSHPRTYIAPIIFRRKRLIVFIAFDPFSDAEIVWVDRRSPGGQGLDCPGVEAALFGLFGLLDCRLRRLTYVVGMTEAKVAEGATVYAVSEWLMVW